jgi:hypothetical protein
VSLLDSIALFSAVMVSLVIATILALVGTYAVSVGGKDAVLHYLHVQELKGNFESLEKMMEANDYGTPANKTSTLQKKNAKKEKKAAKNLQKHEEDKEELPHPFQLPELLINWVMKQQTHSLNEFLHRRTMMRSDIVEYTKRVEELKLQRRKSNMKEKQYRESLPPLPPPQVIKMKVLKEEYERFCFINGYVQMTLLDKENVFKKFDMSFIAESNGTTEVYCRVRWKTKKEKLEAAQAKVSEVDGSSLTRFVRTECVVTLFDSDHIPTQLFYDKYLKFCGSSALLAEPVTKRAIKVIGARFERQSQTNLSSSSR